MRDGTSIDLSALPNLKEWAEGNESFTPLTWLYAKSELETAVAFTALFWPDVIERDGVVLLRAFFDPRVYEEWRNKLGDDKSAIERVMNHRHVGDLLPGADRVGFSNLRYLGQVLAGTWRARLACAFPDRRFEVICDDDPENEEVTVTFWQIRPGAATVPRAQDDVSG
jgi:hypothetical protein